MPSSRALLAALVIVHAAGPAVGEERPRVPAKALAAVRATGPITIDGDLAEPAWAHAEPIDDLVQKVPAYGAKPRHPTEIRVLYDADALYIGARMWSAPGATRAVVTRRDQTRDAERFIVSFDPYRTGRIAYSFAVTVAGVRADWIHTDDDEHTRDMSWDPVWSAATRVVADGWIAELRVPWSQLRYPERAGAVWGVN
ncbi:MAG: carbohydrate binding family 9 domain-containing protein, partial [Kofleriaceae bacterium]